jgi:predicted  nucleic acid-binding Zn-ribbon protein
MTTAVDLEALKLTIHNLGEKVKELKTSSAEKTEIDNAVQALLTAKKEYAQQNNGIGVDGKPFQEPLSKAEKKAQAKATKQAAPEAAAADPEKKAAKKAANKGTMHDLSLSA